MTTSPFNKEEIIRRVNELMEKGFEISPERLVPDATIFGDLELDSLDAVDMLVHLEENFKVKVQGERLAQVRKLSDIYALVEEVLAPSLSDSASDSKAETGQNLSS